jgi:hypothetical protein
MKFNDWLFLEEFRTEIFNKELINYHILGLFKHIISESLSARGFIEEKLLIENDLDPQEDDEVPEVDDPFSGDEDAKPSWVTDTSEEPIVSSDMKKLKDAMLLYYWKYTNKKIPGVEGILDNKSLDDLRNEIADLIFKIFQSYSKKLANDPMFAKLGFEWTDLVSRLYENFIKLLQTRGLPNLGNNLSDLDVDSSQELSQIKMLGKKIIKNSLKYEMQSRLRKKVKQQNYKVVLINSDLANNNFNFYKTYYSTGNVIQSPNDDSWNYGGKIATPERKIKAAKRYRKEIADAIETLSGTKKDLYPIENPTDENIKLALQNYLKNFGFEEREVPMSALSKGKDKDGAGDDFDANIERSLRGSITPGSSDGNRDPLGIAKRDGEINQELADKIRKAFSELFRKNRNWGLVMCIGLGVDCAQDGLPINFQVSPLYKTIKTGVSTKFDQDEIVEKLKNYGIIASKQNVRTWLMNARDFLEGYLKDSI